MSTLPNLIIAGVAKSGTTSLFWYLGDHPDVAPADVKELHYFSPLAEGRPLRSLDEYARHFRRSHGAPYRLEASPDYFYGGAAVRAAIAETLPDVRIIISLREPVQRLWSAYTFLKAMGRLPATTTFEEALCGWQHELDQSRSAAGDARATPLSVGFYLDALQDWDAMFAGRLRIVFADDLFDHPQAALDDLHAWLRVPRHEVSKERLTRRNETIHARSARLARFAYRAKGLSDHILARWPGGRSVLRRAYATLNSQAPQEALAPETRARLESLYAPANRQLAAFLSHRGYERLPAWLSDGA